MAEENALKHWLVPFAWDKTLSENGHAFYFGTEEVLNDAIGTILDKIDTIKHDLDAVFDMINCNY